MAPKSRPRLVLADDDEMILAWLAAQLESEFECVGTAADAPGAVALALAERPDIVILSGNESGGGVIDLLEAGATTYLRKGIEAQELVDCLSVALSAHQHEAQRKLPAAMRPGAPEDAAAPPRTAA